MDALMDLITDLQEARTAGRTDEQLATVRDLQCEAQFSRDFIATETRWVSIYREYEPWHYALAVVWPLGDPGGEA